MVFPPLSFLSAIIKPSARKFFFWYFYFILFYFILFYFIFFVFLGPHLRHMEAPRLGVQLEL